MPHDLNRKGGGAEMRLVGASIKISPTPAYTTPETAVVKI